MSFPPSFNLFRFTKRCNIRRVCICRPRGLSRERALLVEDALRSDRTPFLDSMTVVEALAKLHQGRVLAGGSPKRRSCRVARSGDGAAIERSRRGRPFRPQAGRSSLRIGFQRFHYAETLPHVHMDHSLDTAQRRMANGRTNVLPVIHRTNIRLLNGVLAMEDIQSAYGIEQSEEHTEPDQTKGMSAKLLLRMVAVTLSVLVLIGVVTRAYKNEHSQRAAKAYQEGVSLQSQGRAEEAVEQFRAALSSSPDNREYRLGLGSALVQAQHPEEASLYLNAVLKTDPDNGPANLGMARITAGEGTLAQVTAAYHKAIFGVWPKAREQEHQEVSLELADYLFKQGAQAEAALELSRDWRNGRRLRSQ